MLSLRECRGPAHARALAGAFLTFRAPHYTASTVGLRQELRLAVGGVLYLDEAAEFRREAIDALCAEIAAGGPLPLAILVGTLNPFRSDGPEPNASAERLYAARVDALIGNLEQAREALRARQ